MKLLILNGTPKTDGLCHSFVKASEEAAVSCGIKTETVQLSSLNLTKCKMCGNGWGICFSEHKCAFGDGDGFNDLQMKVKNADAFIYITPVYWGLPSEDLKLFLDKLRRCQATKQWDSRDDEASFLRNKPSIIVASAGGGGGGIISTFVEIEQAISHMDGKSWVYGGIFDYIAVNRWNQDYKREALKAAIKEMHDIWSGKKEAPKQNR